MVLGTTPNTGKTRVNVDSGDLEFVARTEHRFPWPRGDIRFWGRAINILTLGYPAWVHGRRGNVNSALTFTSKFIK